MQMHAERDSKATTATDIARHGNAAAAAAGPSLTSALLDSRQCWRDLVAISADFVFETDRAGRFAFVAPDPALGWPSAALLGQPADMLLPSPDKAALFDPFRPATTLRRRRTWLRNAEGRAVCLEFSVMPLFDAAGDVIGARGLARDVTDQDATEGALAAALHRRELVDFILTRMRQEVLAPRMMKAALQALVQGTGAEGCAVMDMLGEIARVAILHSVGTGSESLDERAVALLARAWEMPQTATLPDGRPAIVAPCQTRFGEEAGLIIWRALGARAWDPDDLALVGSATNVIRIILEHASIQSEMARQARTDPLTGLLNRRAFFEEIERRIARLERDGLPATLLYIDLDYFKALNDRRGHDVGDDALRIVGAVLRATVRPSDLIARLGGDEFVLWLDGADHLAGAERAESLRTAVPDALAHLGSAETPKLTCSIGIATRWAGRGEDIDAVMTRADQMMYEVKRQGRGGWRVSESE